MEGNLKMTSVFIDGKEGTTGLKIFERLAKREDISIITLDESERKDASKRKQALNSCGIAFLCLPDAAAAEAAEFEGAETEEKETEAETAEA